MPAYVISDVVFRDPQAIEAYRSHAAHAIAHHGGRYLARGGAVQTLEGTWRPERIIIVEFPDMARAHAWYASPEYAEALRFRDAALSRDLILVDGVAPST